MDGRLPLDFALRNTARGAGAIVREVLRAFPQAAVVLAPDGYAVDWQRVYDAMDNGADAPPPPAAGEPPAPWIGRWHADTVLAAVPDGCIPSGNPAPARGTRRVRLVRGEGRGVST